MTLEKKADIISFAAADAAVFLENRAVQKICISGFKERRLKISKKGIDKEILV